MNQNEWLTKKQAEIRAHLEREAQEDNILGPGEQLVFSMRIEKVPIVPEERGAKSALDITRLPVRELM